MTRIPLAHSEDSSTSSRRRDQPPKWLVIPDYSVLSASIDRPVATEDSRSLGLPPIPGGVIPLPHAPGSDPPAASPDESTPHVPAPHVTAPHSASVHKSPKSESPVNRVSPIVSRLDAGRASVVAAGDRVRKLVKSLPKRPKFGWQRTVLLLVGGSLLAYSLSGSRNRSDVASESTLDQDVATADSLLDSEIHRMSHAPLRIGRTETPLELASKPPAASDDAIFRVPVIRTETSDTVVDEVTPAAPEGEFPVIGAPDGSAISRYRAQTPGRPNATRPTSSSGPMRALMSARGTESAGAAQSVHAEQKPWPLERETIAERAFVDEHRGGATHHRESQPAAQQISYPYTRRSKYRDPEYVIPSVADRRHKPSR